jgi:hypothetical protein
MLGCNRSLSPPATLLLHLIDEHNELRNNVTTLESNVVLY